MYKKVEHGLVRGLIFCRMKILTMPRKKFKIAMLNEAVFMVKKGVNV